MAHVAERLNMPEISERKRQHNDLAQKVATRLFFAGHLKRGDNIDDVAAVVRRMLRAKWN